jgi:hypothetical protein
MKYLISFMAFFCYMVGISETGVASEEDKIGPWGPQPIMHPASIQKSPDKLPFRSWQLQNDDNNARKIIAAAKEFGINNIQLSHLQVMYAHKLMQNPLKIERFNEYIDLAHQNGATVHIWTHEFGGIPKSITRENKWFDKPEVWELLDERYTRLFEVMPELDGVVLTFHETEIKVFDVESDLPLADRVAKLINHLHATFKRLDKTLVVRTFAYEPEEVEGVTDAFAMIDPDIILMSKCVPHDWEVFYPHNLAIGRYADRMHIIEFDPGAEYYGKGHVPYLYPEYLHFRLQYARERNAYGYVARVERQRHPSAIPGISEGSGLNELNLYAMQRFAEDPAVSPDTVWREYIEKRVGTGAYVEPLIEALKLTDDVLNRCYFMLGIWYNDHSRLPSKEYADSHVDFIQKWHEAYKPVVKRLLNPDARTVGEVFRESEESVILAQHALDHLELSREAGLPEAHYSEYRGQLSKLLDTAKLWAEHRNAYIQEKAGGVEPAYDGPFPIGGPPRIEK